MADDVWAGIPVELRDVVLRYAGTVGAYYADDGVVESPDVEYARDRLIAELRSLVSRLQEAEKDTERLNWMERQDWSASGVLLGKLPLRRSVDQALELERN